MVALGQRGNAVGMTSKHDAVWAGPFTEVNTGSYLTLPNKLANYLPDSMSWTGSTGWDRTRETGAIMLEVQESGSNVVWRDGYARRHW